MALDEEQTLLAIARLLKSKYKCHTAILYGSRARGESTVTSDYDVVGIRKTGAKTRIARLSRENYWDVFVYPEKDVKNLESFLHWRGGKVLFDTKGFGDKLLRKIRTLYSRPHKSQPAYEIKALKVWAHKQLSRIRTPDAHGLYRQAELQRALLEDYFVVRRQRYHGPKAALGLLEKNDPAAFKFIVAALQSPKNLPRAVRLVYGI